VTIIKAADRHVQQQQVRLAPAAAAALLVGCGTAVQEAALILLKLKQQQ
jgi:hypothetical protein